MHLSPHWPHFHPVDKKSCSFSFYPFFRVSSSCDARFHFLYIEESCDLKAATFLNEMFKNIQKIGVSVTMCNKFSDLTAFFKKMEKWFSVQVSDITTYDHTWFLQSIRRLKAAGQFAERDLSWLWWICGGAKVAPVGNACHLVWG